MNRYKYIAYRLWLLLAGVLCTFIGLFLPKRHRIILTASLNKEFADNSQALFLALLEDEYFSDKTFFVINDVEKRKQLNHQYPSKFISNTDIRSLFFILSAKYWIANSLEFPAPGYANRFIRTVYHLGHGMPLKKAGILENNSGLLKRLYYRLVTSNISYSIAPSSFFVRRIAAIYGLPLKRMLCLPQPKTDLIYKPKKPKDPLLENRRLKHFLYAPTWRHNGDIQFFPFDDCNLDELNRFLGSNQIIVWIRVHPRFEQSIPDKILSLDNVRLFSASDYPEVNYYFFYFDVIITDYSSIYFDFMILEKPVLFFDYDIKTFSKSIGLIDGYEHLKPVASTTSMELFKKQVLSIINGEYDHQNIKKVKTLSIHPKSINGKGCQYLIEWLFPC